MKKGYYFQLNNDVPTNNSATFFDYCQFELSESSEGDTIEYSVSVVMSRNSIDFTYIHPDACDIITLFSLPLQDDNQSDEALTSILLDLVEDSYPLKSKAVGKDEFRGYSGLNFSKDIEEIKKRLGEESRTDGYTMLGYSRILLDFIFDFYHTTVFHNSPFYAEISGHLSRNGLFKALAEKAAFKYWQQEFNESSKRNNDKNSDECRTIALILWDSEKQWINNLQRILDKNFEKKFLLSAWFNELETEWKDLTRWFEKKNEVEYRRIVEERSCSEVVDKKDIKQYSSIISSWFIIMYNFFDAYDTLLHRSYIKNRFPQPFVNYLKYLLFYIPPIVTLVFLVCCILHINNNYLILILFITSVIWFITVCISMFTIGFFSFLSLFLPRLVLAIVSAWTFILLPDEIWRLMFILPLFSTTGVVLALVCSVLVFLYAIYECMKKNNHNYIRRGSYIFVYAFVVSLFVGIVLQNTILPEVIARGTVAEDLAKECKRGVDVVDLFAGPVREGRNLDDVMMSIGYRHSLLEKKPLLWRISMRPFRFLGEFADNEWFKCIKEWQFYLRIFPDSLVFCSLFSVFWGVFFLMVMDDKKLY